VLGPLDVPTEGHVSIMGQDTAAMNADERARMRLETLGFVFQFHFLLPEFSALGNVTIPMRRLGRLSNSEMIARGTELLSTLGIEDHMHKRPDQLVGRSAPARRSGTGARQRPAHCAGG
jgi:lipoprotein-releasing system ATP-binding protein